jgi:hypothetical protein
MELGANEVWCSFHHLSQSSIQNLRKKQAGTSGPLKKVLVANRGVSVLLAASNEELGSLLSRSRYNERLGPPYL